MSPIIDPHFASAHRAGLDKEREESARAARMEYIKPIVMLGIGAGAMIAILTSSAGDEEISGATVAAFYPIKLAIELAIGVAALWIAAKLWLGGVDTLGLAIVRLAGIYAMSDLIAQATAPLMILGWLITFVCYIGMLMWLFELEAGEAMILAIITFLLKLAVGAVLLMTIMGAA
jgi:hypothetical protein